MQNNNQTQTATFTYEEKNAAALSYIWIMSIFIYLLKKKNPYIRFHASQATALFILSIIAWFIPVIHQGLLFILGIFMIMGFIKASQGEWFKIPLISQLVFSNNPVKSTWLSLGKTLSYLFTWIQSKCSNSQKIQEILEQKKNELLQKNKNTTPLSETDSKRKNDIAAFAYIPVLSVIIALTNKDSAYVQFHAKQGVVLFILFILFFTLPLIGFYLNILILLLCITGFIMAFSGEQFNIPVISFLVEKNPSFEDFYLHIKTFFAYIHYALARSIDEEKNKKTWQDIKQQVRETYNTKKEKHEKEEQNKKDIAAASYIFLAPLLFFIHRKNPFVRFHAKQGILLLVLLIITLFFEPLRWLSILILTMMLIGFIKSLQSQYYPMPFIYDMLHCNITIQGTKNFLLNIVRFLFKGVKRLFASDKE